MTSILLLAATPAETAQAVAEGNQVTGLVFVFGLFTFLVLVVASTKFVSQGHAGILERMGKYAKTVGPGVHFLMPVFSRLVRVSLKEQIDHYAPQPVITKDSLWVRVDAVLFFRIIDPKKAVYDVENYVSALETLTMTTLRDVIGSMSLSECLKSREPINARLRAVLDEATGRWGVKVTGVEIKSIEPPKDFREAMEEEKRAEIERNAAILRSEGHRKAAMNQAEGEKQANISRAEGEREALKLRAEGERDASRLKAEGQAQAYSSLFTALKQSGVDNQVLSIRYLETLEKVANGKATTLILPYDSAGVLSAVAQVAQTLGAVGDGKKGKGLASSAMNPTKAKDTLPTATETGPPLDPALPPA